MRKKFGAQYKKELSNNSNSPQGEGIPDQVGGSLPGVTQAEVTGPLIGDATGGSVHWTK